MCAWDRFSGLARTSSFSSSSSSSFVVCSTSSWTPDRKQMLSPSLPPFFPFSFFLLNFLFFLPHFSNLLFLHHIFFFFVFCPSPHPIQICITLLTFALVTASFIISYGLCISLCLLMFFKLFVMFLGLCSVFSSSPLQLILLWFQPLFVEWLSSSFTLKTINVTTW